LTRKGGIALTLGKQTTGDKLETYYEGAVYTIFFTLLNYIPSGGTLKI